MVALAAMPRPIETMTASTKPGDLVSRRKVYARSCRQAATVFSPPVDYYVATRPIVPLLGGKVVERLLGYPDLRSTAIQTSAGARLAVFDPTTCRVIAGPFKSGQTSEQIEVWSIRFTWMKNAIV